MHELPLVERVLEIALARARAAGARAVIGISLSVGGLSDVEPAWIERYFCVAARGGPAQYARLHIRVEPARAACASCLGVFDLERPLPQGAILCPSCGSDRVSLVADPGWRVESMEVV